MRIKCQRYCTALANINFFPEFRAIKILGLTVITEPLKKALSASYFFGSK